MTRAAPGLADHRPRWTGPRGGRVRAWWSQKAEPAILRARCHGAPARAWGGSEAAQALQRGRIERRVADAAAVLDPAHAVGFDAQRRLRPIVAPPARLHGITGAGAIARVGPAAARGQHQAREPSLAGIVER